MSRVWSWYEGRLPESLRRLSVPGKVAVAMVAFAWAFLILVAWVLGTLEGDGQTGLAVMFGLIYFVASVAAVAVVDRGIVALVRWVRGSRGSASPSP